MECQRNSLSITVYEINLKERDQIYLIFHLNLMHDNVDLNDLSQENQLFILILGGYCMIVLSMVSNCIVYVPLIIIITASVRIPTDFLD